jgi:hypothetical protein
MLRHGAAVEAWRGLAALTWPGIVLPGARCSAGGAVRADLELLGAHFEGLVSSVAELQPRQNGGAEDTRQRGCGHSDICRPHPANKVLADEDIRYRAGEQPMRQRTLEIVGRCGMDSLEAFIRRDQFASMVCRFKFISKWDHALQIYGTIRPSRSQLPFLSEHLSSSNLGEKCRNWN